MNKIIAISREFGSGGRELGKRLADVLGFAYYDREIVTALAKETGLNEEYLEQQLERSTAVSYPVHFASSFAQFSTEPDSSVEIRSLQSKLIRELAEKGDCVIVGRAADTLLEAYRPFCLFVCADEEAKLARCRARATEAEHLTDREILRRMKRIDKARAEYHNIISSTSWGEMSAYHLCVNTTGTEIKTIVPAIAEYYRLWLKASVGNAQPET